jgi:hypothetical protein
MKSIAALATACLVLPVAPLYSQQHVSPAMMYHRVYAVVPLVGKGTKGDPRRPMLVPAPSAAPKDHTGLLGYQMQLSDDGKFALVEFVFSSPAAFRNVLAQAAVAQGIPIGAQVMANLSADSGSGQAAAIAGAQLKSAFESAVPGLKIFERGHATAAEITAEFQKYKKNFTVGAGMVIPQ